MAWTTPMTFIDNTVLTAAQLNTHLRDNFLETVPAKSTNNGGAGGGYFAVTGPYSIAERGVAYSEINFTESTTSTAPTDLATAGPSVSAVTGSVALVLYSSEMNSNTDNGKCITSLEVTGKTDVPASDSYATISVSGNGSRNACGSFAFFDNLTPGYNIFRLKYASGSDSSTATFRNRRIILLPF